MARPKPANAPPSWPTLKKTAQLPADAALVCLDEFALQSVPNTHYAWAPQNSAPTIPSDERHREKLNGFLTVDLLAGTTHVDFRTESRADDVVFVLALTALRFARLGYHCLTVILDNCRIHGERMKAALAELLAEMEPTCNLTVDFLHTPRYSPNFNPAEYLIHWVRQDALYHLPCTFTLQDKAERVQRRLAQGPPLDSQQMQNLVRHIERLPKTGWS
jgi:hypothetical protein